MPFYGSVVSIDRELGAYRLHCRNLWAFSRTVDLPGVSPACDSASGTTWCDLLLSDPEHVLLRLVTLRYDPAGQSVVDDRVSVLVRHGLRHSPTTPAPDRCAGFSRAARCWLPVCSRAGPHWASVTSSWPAGRAPPG